MLADALDGSHVRKHFFFIPQYISIDKLRSSLGHRTRLIEHYRINSAKPLQTFCIFKEYAALCTPAYACDYRRRRGKSQSARACYDKHAYKYLYRHRKAVGYPPNYACNYSDTHHDRHKHTRHPVGDTRDRRLGILRLFHQRDYL